MKRLVHRLSAAALAAWLMVLGQLAFQAEAAYAVWPPHFYSSTECEDGADPKPCEFTVDFGDPLNSPVWFFADTVSITAVADGDFVPLIEREVYAPAGVSSITISVEIIIDNECEPRETFALRLSGGSLGRDVLEQKQEIIDRAC